MNKKIVVVGAGITGITTAYFLAKKGHDVTVLEKESYPAMQTSYANGGQLSVSNSDVWTTKENVAKGLKWMFKKDAPLLVNPTPSIPKLKWLAGFIGNVLRDTAKSHTLTTIELGLHARDLYFKIADDEGIDFNLVKKGILHVYRDYKELDEATKHIPFYQNAGVWRYRVSPNEIKNFIEPAYLGTNFNILGGIYTPDDATGDIHKFCNNLAEVLKTKYGVKFQFDTTVDRISSVPNGKLVVFYDNQGMIPFVDDVVICAGVNSPSLAKSIGESINVYPVKGYSITIALDEESEKRAPTVSILDESAKIVTSKLGNRLRVAGTAELADWNYDIRAERIEPLVNWVKSNFPDINMRDVKPWAGLRPMTPSMLPIVRESTTRNVWLNTGHGHLGWTLGAATAQIIADQI